MLSSLWNQIANADSDSSDDDSFLSKTEPDDIAAASLLTAFPSYGSHRKALALEPTSPNNLSGPASVSSIVSGDWDFSPKGKGRRKTDARGFAGLEDILGSADDDSVSLATAVSAGPERKKKGERSGELAPWSEDESNLWSDSKKKRKSSRRGRSQSSRENAANNKKNDLHYNEEIRRQWIHGNNAAGNSSAVNAGGAIIRQDNRDREAFKRSNKKHFTFDDDTTIGTDSTSSDDDRSAIEKTDSGTSSSLKDLDEKSLWMPDKLCKKCYACEAQFTVFRRRHHCRLCGQVFCSRCSSCFVEIVGGRLNQNLPEEQNQEVDIKTIRTCKVCYEQISASGPNGLSWSNGNSAQGEERMGKTPGIGGSSKERQTGSIRNLPQMEDSVPESQVIGFQGASSNDFLNLALVKQKLEEDRKRREEEERALAEAKEERRHQNPMKNISSTITRRFGRLAESAAREAQVGDTGYNDEETALIGTGVRDEAPASPSVKKESEPTLEANSSFSPSNNASVDNQKENSRAIRKANRQVSLMAADYLEKMGRELLLTDAPTLLKEFGINASGGRTFDKWVSNLMMLATKCCTSVQVDLKHGDLLDIRPYCKVKAIPGGALKDAAFISGVVFHKNVSHKSMARGIQNPRIMLLSGGIDYTRTDHRIASLNTLLEQEEKYLQILVAKITKLKPDILIVGRSVSRKAQELLLGTNIVLLQHVKSSLIDRIARQTGAKILSSTDHVMNQFGVDVLGKCRRFRLVTFRDNDMWNNKWGAQTSDKSLQDIQKRIVNIDDRKKVEDLLIDADISNHQRQSILAANLLGERVHDGGKAVRKGILKRGVAQTYIMIEGCPAHLGCTVVLRGASRPALKEVKKILKFLINVAYNLKLETSYFRLRRAKLPSEDFKLSPKLALSSSMCVDYGIPPQGRNSVRPWNGNSDPVQRSISGAVTALEYQSLLISSVWMAGKTQCCPAQVKGICYYSQQDVSLGQFLRDSCFNLTLKCQNPSCKKSVLEHTLSFVHNDGLIKITVEELDGPIPSSERPEEAVENLQAEDDKEDRIATWTYCVNCRKVVTPLAYIDEDTWKYSFGKFLEVSFYNKSFIVNAPEHKCQCQMQGQSTLFFACGNLAARFTYERIRPYTVFLRRYLPFDESYHKKFTVLELNEIMLSSSDLFERFNKHVETTIRETRDLFVSAVNKSEHIQTLLSELHSISKEVSHASGVLKSKIVSVTNRYNTFNQNAESGYSYGELGHSAQDAFSHFPWYARRYIFMLTSAWNERLSAIGQALSAMKKVVSVSQKLSIGSRSDIGIPQGVGADGELDDVLEAMQRIKEIREIYSDFNIGDMDIQSSVGGLPDKRNLEDTDDIEDEDFNNDLPGSADDDIAINFSEEVDADVLASRRRRSARKQDSTSSRSSSKRGMTEDEEKQRGKQKPPRRRSKERTPYTAQVTSRDSFASTSSRNSSPSPQQKAKAVSAGGAVKSAFNRLFNRGGKEDNPNIVDLGIFNHGRPKLEPGVGGVIIPVFDDQPSTIIAHSLASVDYESKFRRHTRAYLKESGSFKRGGGSEPITEGQNIIEDFLSGPNSTDSQRKKKYDSRSSRRGRNEQRKNAAARVSSSKMKITNDKADVEKRMLVRNKTHIKHIFRDYDEKGAQIAKFVCTTFWSTQFQAVRQAFLKDNANSAPSSGSTYGKNIIEKNFVRSLAASLSFNAVGGKSGASFFKTADDRFIVKSISRTELQMFLDCAPAYFEYLSKAYFHGLPTMLCKIVGVFQIGYHNRETGKGNNEQFAVMQNMFYGRNVSKVFDLKGTLRGRFAKHLSQNKRDKTDARSSSSPVTVPKKKNFSYGSDSDASSDEDGEYPSSNPDSEDEDGTKDEPKSSSTLLDGDFLEFTGGRPLPLTDLAKDSFRMSILNDTLFLSIINVLDYSILVGIDEEKNELIVGIIDFFRQYDILKQMERVGKSIPMVVGSEAPTIIQPPLYKARFISAMERYFMTVPNKWTSIW